MRLTLAIHPITEVKFGTTTKLEGTALRIDQDELRSLLMEDERLESVDLEVVRPGENCRIGWVFDVVEPRVKEPGDGPDFPGIIGPYEPVGKGTTHVLRGAAVTVLDEGGGQTRRGGTRILEISGPAADASPFGDLQHLVVGPHAKPEMERHAVLNAVRVASVKAAVYLAKAAIGHRPAATEVFDLEGPTVKGREGLPRLVYINQVHGHQHGTWADEHIFYGGNTAGLVPLYVHPNEWLDGALVISYSWNNGVETYFYQNNPIIEELYEGHQAGELTFLGTIVMAAADVADEGNRNCMLAAHLAKEVLHADGAVVSKYVGGAPHADMFETARNCERMGVKTVVLASDWAMNDRRVESALLMNIPEVDAVVCIGSGGDIKWQLPAAERVIASNPAIAARLELPQELSAGGQAGITNNQGAAKIFPQIY